MKHTLYLLVIFQMFYLAVMVSSLETMTEAPFTEGPDLEDSFLNISSSLKNIKEKIGVLTDLLPKAFPTNSSERAEPDQNLDVDVSHYNGTYDSIFEKVENIKNKVKEIKSTLRSLSISLDSEFGLDKLQKKNNDS